ncbi:MAG: hypothetical protein KGL46_00370 [Hyphomicrobiales bacterium]|nr:hypothetical protein [Hyphomicrobiales bacterium]
MSLENLSVAQDSELRLGFYVPPFAVDCTPRGDVAIHVLQEPAHGAVSVVETQDFAEGNRASTDPRAKCLTQKRRGYLVKYKPAKGYVGEDVIVLDIIATNGFSVRRNITAHVR